MTDKAREEFEAWAKTQDWNIDFMWHDGYDAWETKFAFDAWQASRAAMVIELPEGFETYCGSTEERVIYADEMKDVLEAAGLKVKS